MHMTETERALNRSLIDRYQSRSVSVGHPPRSEGRSQDHPPPSPQHSHRSYALSPYAQHHPSTHKVQLFPNPLSPSRQLSSPHHSISHDHPRLPKTVSPLSN
eukprot:TRINITY_DN1823_c0_g1_i4.p1 TRINITY_DN1823_c0_g1~~TRINITY_DN1823_c0_g1_i4.p1  ORF type:complete len:102 (-),score=12.25 TRINITY_DN1823_c0_g1_i4:265-570(-)